MFHLLGHHYKGMQDVFLLSRIKQDAQGMMGTVRIPDPVVRVKGPALILMDLASKAL